MRSCRVLIPLFTAILVLQGVVGLVPHQHGSARPEAPGIHESVDVDEVHDCLACAVHVPLVEPTTGGGFMSVAEVVAVGGSGDPEQRVVDVPNPFGPRGPPST